MPHACPTPIGPDVCLAHSGLDARMAVIEDSCAPIEGRLRVVETRQAEVRTTLKIVGIVLVLAIPLLSTLGSWIVLRVVQPPAITHAAAVSR